MEELPPKDPGYGGISAIMAALGHKKEGPGRDEFWNVKNETVQYRKTYAQEVLDRTELPTDFTSPIIKKLVDDLLQQRGRELFPSFWTIETEAKRIE
jgi:hypothetical protein